MSVVLKNITKSYGSVKAIENIDLEIHPGEVIGLVGDNGAGKSTLMKVLAGAVRPNEGTIEVDGTAHVFEGSSDARAAGIEMLYQDLALFDDLPVVMNVFIGGEVGIGVVMVSHDLGHVRQVCDRVAILHLGTLVGVRDLATTSQDEIISLIVEGHAPDAAA